MHRPVYLDYVGVKMFDRVGRVVGEHRFIGLFSASAYTQSVEGIPVIDRKVRRVREVLGFSRGSHGGRDLMAFLETFPRDELFAIDTDELTTDRRGGAEPQGAPGHAAVRPARHL